MSVFIISPYTFHRHLLSEQYWCQLCRGADTTFLPLLAGQWVLDLHPDISIIGSIDPGWGPALLDRQPTLGHLYGVKEWNAKTRTEKIGALAKHNSFEEFIIFFSSYCILGRTNIWELGYFAAKTNSGEAFFCPGIWFLLTGNKWIEMGLNILYIIGGALHNFDPL